MIRTFLTRWAADERGATAIEYGLIAALIAMGVIVSVRSVGGNLKATFNNVGNAAKGT